MNMFFDVFLGLGMLNFTTAILYKVFLGIAVYKDATNRKDKNAVLWTVLIILFGLIPLIIYAVVVYQKEKELIRCPHCGNLVSKKFPVCMYCKQHIKEFNENSIISEEVKKYLIIAAVIFFINKIISIAMTLSNYNKNIFFNMF